MNITPDIQALRDATGSQVNECERALEAAHGDVDLAKRVLEGHIPTIREIMQARSSAGRAGPVGGEARMTARSARAAGAEPGNGIHLVGTERVGVLPADEAVLMVTLAEDLAAQSGKMMQQADRLAALIRFAERLRDAMAAAASSAVRLDVTPAEENIASFLLTQARARSALVERTRYRHVCRVCGMSTLSNPEYEKLVAHKRRVDAATRGLGVAFLTAGTASPVVMANSLFAFRSQKPDYHCPRCQALDTDQSVVVFCPQCKAQHDKALLKQCAKCGYDFTKAVDLSDLWRPLEAAAVPPPAGEKLSELRLEDQPMMLAFLPDARRLLAATQNSVQLWDTGGAGGEPQQVWDFSLGTGVLVLAALSSDSQLVAVGQRNAAYARLLRAADGAEVKNMGWHSSVGWGVSGLVFRPDGGALVAAVASRVETWSLTGQPNKAMKLGLTVAARLVACSPDGAHIAAVGSPTTSSKRDILFVWSASKGDQPVKFTFDGLIKGIAWSADSAAMALAVGNSVELISIPGGQQRANFTLDEEVTRVAFNPDGRYLAAAAGHSAHVLDLRTQTEVARISRPDVVTAVAFAPDDRLAVGDAGSIVQFWTPPAHAEGPPGATEPFTAVRPGGREQASTMPAADQTA